MKKNIQIASLSIMMLRLVNLNAMDLPPKNNTDEMKRKVSIIDIDAEFHDINDEFQHVFLQSNFERLDKNTQTCDDENKIDALQNLVNNIVCQIKFLHAENAEMKERCLNNNTQEALMHFSDKIHRGFIDTTSKLDKFIEVVRAITNDHNRLKTSFVEAKENISELNKTISLLKKQMRKLFKKINTVVPENDLTKTKRSKSECLIKMTTCAKKITNCFHMHKNIGVSLFKRLLSSSKLFLTTGSCKKRLK